MIQQDYGILKRSITTQNPQANDIVGRIHQNMGNMFFTFCAHETELDKGGLWTGILGAFMFATRATVHSTDRATQEQLVFGCDAILNVQHEANWAT